ncbi:MAG: replicative DNA helicase, partial [Patescibacteria group bacterium]
MRRGRMSKMKEMSEGLRIPPHSYEAEESVLGSLMVDKNAIVKIADFLGAEDFYKTRHQTIYAAMVELYNSGEPIDVLSVIHRLKERGELEEVGGEVAVTHLATVVPTAGHVVHYARIVQGTATRRRLISAAADITEMGFTEADDVQTTLDSAEQTLFSVSKDYKHQKFTRLSEALEDAFARIDKLQKGESALRGVPTGFKQLDLKLAGWQKSDLIVLAARPSVGKSTLALDFARHAASAGTPVGIFSLEMSRDQLVDRLLAAHAHVDLWKLRTGRLESGAEEFDDFSRLGQAMGELSQLPIYIDDHAS